MPTESVNTEPVATAPEPEELETDPQSALQRVEQLLAGNGAEPEKAPDESKPAETWDLAGLAEKLQATPEKLYALKVPIADGESLTLGELKDGYRTANAVTVEREAVKTDRTKLQVERREALEELDQLVRHLPREALTPDAIRSIQDWHRGQRQTELAKLLEAEPEMKDPVRWAADRPVIEDYAKGFGYSAEDLNATLDHRLLRVLRAGALRERDLKAAKAVAPKPKAAQAPKSGNHRTPAQVHGQLKAAVTTRRMAPVNAVEQLLKGR